MIRAFRHSGGLKAGTPSEIASTVLLGSVLLRLYGGSTLSTAILPQFVVMSAVPVVATVAWLRLRGPRATASPVPTDDTA